VDRRVTRLADHLLIRRAFDELALLESGSGADESDEVGCVDGPPAGLCGLDELEPYCDAGCS